MGSFGRGVARLGANGARIATSSIAAVLRAPAHVSMGLVIVLATLFMLVNASAVFGASAPRFQGALLVYLVMASVFMANFGQRSPLAGVSVASFVSTFAVWFVGSAIVLLAFAQSTGFRPPTIEHTTSSFVLIVMTVFVIAANEEIIFRDILPNLLRSAAGGILGAQFLSAIVFALFHFSVYDGSVGLLLAALVAGIIFGLIKESVPNGLTAVIAVHSAWNAFALGLLTVTGV